METGLLIKETGKIIVLTGMALKSISTALHSKEFSLKVLRKAKELSNGKMDLPTQVI
jgi:hypothetical protein